MKHVLVHGHNKFTSHETSSDLFCLLAAVLLFFEPGISLAVTDDGMYPDKLILLTFVDGLFLTFSLSVHLVIFLLPSTW